MNNKQNTLKFKESLSLGEPKENQPFIVNQDSIEMIKQIKLESKKPIIKIGFIGNSRSGKSTLINIFCSYLLGHSTNTFKTDKGKNQCTKGIQVNVVELKDICIVFTDYRGTNNGGATQDLFLTFFAYIDSDILILTEQKIIYNSTLQNGLGSSVTFVNEIKDMLEKYKLREIKHLVFRIQDFVDTDDLGVEKMQKYIDDILNCDEKDQYEQYRKAIKKLFKYENIHCIPTLAPERKQLTQLNENHDFYSILQDEDSLFRAFCNDIMNIAFDLNKKEQDFSDYINEFHMNIQTVISKNVNSTDKILAFNSYDAYNSGLIRTYIEQRQPEINSLVELPVFCYFNLDDKIVQINSFIDKFKSTFEEIEDDFKIKILTITIDRLTERLKKDLMFLIRKHIENDVSTQTVIKDIQNLLQNRINNGEKQIFSLIDIKNVQEYGKYTYKSISDFFKRLNTDLYLQIHKKTVQSIENDILYKMKFDQIMRQLSKNQKSIIQGIIYSLFDKNDKFQKEIKKDMEKQGFANRFLDLFKMNSSLDRDFDEEDVYKLTIDSFRNDIQNVIKDYFYEDIAVTKYNLQMDEGNIEIKIDLQGVNIQYLDGKLIPQIQTHNIKSRYFTDLQEKYIKDELIPLINDSKPLYIEAKKQYMNTISTFQSKDVYKKNKTINFVTIMPSGNRKHKDDFQEHKQFTEKSSFVVHDYVEFSPVKSNTQFNICKNELTFFDQRSNYKNRNVTLTLSQLITRGFLTPIKIDQNYYHLMYTEMMDNLLFNNYVTYQLHKDE